MERRQFMLGTSALALTATTALSRLPLYTSAKGLPIGSQFAARVGGEATLLHLAYELENALPWAGRWPEISAHQL